jgi:hypothetical protein
VADSNPTNDWLLACSRPSAPFSQSLAPLQWWVVFPFSGQRRLLDANDYRRDSGRHAVKPTCLDYNVGFCENGRIMICTLSQLIQGALQTSQASSRHRFLPLDAQQAVCHAGIHACKGPWGTWLRRSASRLLGKAAPVQRAGVKHTNHLEWPADATEPAGSGREGTCLQPTKRWSHSLRLSMSSYGLPCGALSQPSLRQSCEHPS